MKWIISNIKLRSFVIDPHHSAPNAILSPALVKKVFGAKEAIAYHRGNVVDVLSNFPEFLWPINARSARRTEEGQWCGRLDSAPGARPS